MSPAQEVVDLIRANGGEAITNGDDIADWEGAGRLVQSAIDTFGGLDTVVTNAGIVRDRMFVNMSVDEWDAVIRVHLRGTFCPVKHAVDYWRAESKAGRPREGRVVTTSSGAGLHGSIAQTNYSAAKAGIATFTINIAAELGRIGVNANSIAPSARSRMTEEAFAEMMAKPETGFDAMDPANISPLVVWLGSGDCNVSGRVFECAGGLISLADGWQVGAEFDKGAKWEPSEIGAVVGDLVTAAPAPFPVHGT
jgi:NAD(P)-dependent dehydrogenase (short-subunit alcohol dehydrogenase family)